jgi:hypothetical protein
MDFQVQTTSLNRRAAPRKPFKSPSQQNKKIDQENQPQTLNSVTHTTLPCCVFSHAGKARKSVILSAIHNSITSQLAQPAVPRDIASGYCLYISVACRISDDWRPITNPAAQR